METRSTRYLSFPTSIHVLQYTIHLLLTMHGNKIIHKFNKVMNTQQQLARTTTPVIVTRVIMAGPALQTYGYPDYYCRCPNGFTGSHCELFFFIDLFKVVFFLNLLVTKHSCDQK